MGWTSSHVAKGRAKQYLMDTVTCDNENVKMEPIRGAFADFGTFYAAVRTTVKATGKSYVWMYVCLVRYYPHDYHNFSYKDMDETCGPLVSSYCPATILKELSSIEDCGCSETGAEYAKSFREACWNAINAKKALKHGTIIKLSRTLRFSNGANHDTFLVIKIGRKTRYTTYENGQRGYGFYGLSRRILQGYSVVGNIAA